MSRRKSLRYYGREGIILWISLSSDKYVFSGMLTSGNTMRLLASLKPLPRCHIDRVCVYVLRTRYQ